MKKFIQLLTLVGVICLSSSCAKIFPNWKIFQSSSSATTTSSVSTSSSISTNSSVSTSSSSISISSSSSLEASSSSSTNPIPTIKGLDPRNPIVSQVGDDTTLDIYFLEMNYLYGDSIFMKLGDIDILIDAGWQYDGTFVRDFIKDKVTDGKLELLMASHAHGDHIGGMPTALSVIDNVDLIVDFGEITGTNEGYTEYKACRDKYIEAGAIYSGAYDCVKETYDYSASRYYLTSDFYFDILNTGDYVKPNTEKSAGNNCSVATIFTYKDFSFYTAGDLTSSGESILVSNKLLKEVTLAKASHHGSSGSNSTALWNVLKPKMVAISAARAGRYNYTGQLTESDLNTNLNGTSGHPHGQAIQRIYASEYIKENKNVYWNMTAGTMCFTTDGSIDMPSFNGSLTKRGYYETGSNVKITGEENFKLSDTKVFQYRNYGFDSLGNFTF